MTKTSTAATAIKHTSQKTPNERPNRKEKAEKTASPESWWEPFAGSSPFSGAHAGAHLRALLRLAVSSEGIGQASGKNETLKVIPSSLKTVSCQHSVIIFPSSFPQTG